MRNLVIILIGLFLMGCEEGQEVGESFNDSKYETVIMADYSTEDTQFYNCEYDFCPQSGQSLVFYKVNSDGQNLTVNVHINSLDSSPYTESYDNMIQPGQILGGEIVDLEYNFGAFGNVNLVISDRDVSVTFTNGFTGMPTLLNF